MALTSVDFADTEGDLHKVSVVGLTADGVDEQHTQRAVKEHREQLQRHHCRVRHQPARVCLTILLPCYMEEAQIISIFSLSLLTL